MFSGINGETNEFKTNCTIKVLVLLLEDHSLQVTVEQEMASIKTSNSKKSAEAASLILPQQKNYKEDIDNGVKISIYYTDFD